MSNEIAVLEEFVANATAVLLETERNLQQLARTALSTYEQLSASQENGQGEDSSQAATRLQQIGQQLTNLSERSKVLQAYLQNGFDTPPADDEYWPRIRILQSQEEERTQLARELEDNVGQLLANAVFELASCQHLLGSDEDAVATGLTAWKFRYSRMKIRSIATGTITRKRAIARCCCSNWPPQVAK